MQVNFFKNTKEFPRPGAWVVADGQLGVIFEVKDVKPDATADDPSPVAVRSAFIHPVTETGESISILGADGRIATKTIVVPADSVQIASHDQITAIQRNSHLAPFDSAVLGYPVTDAQIKGMSALQRKVLNKSLDDADAAQGLIEESQAQLDFLKRQRIAKHPDAIALEEQIEKERQAFITSTEQRRQEMFDKLSSRDK